MKLNMRAISESPKKATLLLAILRFVKTGFALLSMIISARLFGVGLARDYLVICIAATTVIPQLLFGPINEIFRLKYAHILVEEGQEVALRRGSAIMSASFWLLLMVTVLIELYPGAVINIFAPTFATPEHADVLLMARIVIPLLVINQVASGWTYILNAHKVYFLPEIIGIISSGLGVVLVIVLSRWIGIYSLVVSMYVSAIMLMSILIPTVRAKIPAALAIWRCELKLMPPFLKMATPFFLGSILGQILAVVEKQISGAMGIGMISIYDYAQKIISIPLAVVITSIASVLAPSLAGLFAKKLTYEFHKEFAAYIRLALVALCLVIFAFTIGAEDLLGIVFADKLSPSELAIMASTLAFFSVGLVAATVYSLAGQAITACERGKAYAVVAALVQLLVIALNLGVARGNGVQVLAMSWAVAHLLGAAALLVMVGLDRSLLKSLGQASGVYAFAFGAGALVAAIPIPALHPILHLGLLMVAASFGLLLALFVFRTPERRFVLKFASKLAANPFRTGIEESE